MSLKQRLDRATITTDKTRPYGLAVAMPGETEAEALARTGLTPEQYRKTGSPVLRVVFIDPQENQP